MFLLKKIIKYYVLKIKHSSKVKFDFSVNIGINSYFEGMNKIYPNSSFDGHLGFGSYIGPDSKLNGKFKIGKYTSIAPFVTSNPGIHPITVPYVSTSPVFVSLSKQNGSTYTDIQRFDELKFVDEIEKFSVIIGNDCWIGQGVFIVSGINIGHGAVVLAGAVVTKDILPYGIYGGVPAKLLKFRYDKEVIDFLLDFNWWDYDQMWFKDNIDLMSNIELFYKKYKK